MQEEHKINARLSDAEHGNAQGLPGAQRSDVLAAQNDVTVRITARTRPVL
jgi:hypothetical protein